MKKIFLNNKCFTLVDDEDFDSLNQFNWFVVNGYARRQKKIKGVPIRIYLHRVVTNCPDNFCVDHINGNRLDNRKENLRICTKADNQKHSKLIIKTNTSGFRGIVPQKNRWRARISLDNKTRHIGYYDTKQEAAKAYNKIAREYYKEFATLNPL
jgi:hypothetical protein